MQDQDAWLYSGHYAQGTQRRLIPQDSSEGIGLGEVT